MSLSAWILIGAAVAIALYAVVLYNTLVRSRAMVEEGWSGIDVQLKRRANLVPNLVETVKGFAAHERGVFEDVAAARERSIAAGDVAAQQQSENGLTHALGRLFALAEAYPEIKADASFRTLQEQLDAIEDDIQKARRYYNGAVRDLNTRVDQFPSTLVARQFGFRKAAFFEIEDPHSRAVPKVDFGR